MPTNTSGRKNGNGTILVMDHSKMLDRYRATILELLDLIQRDSGYMSPKDQEMVRRARSLVDDKR